MQEFFKGGVKFWEKYFALTEVQATVEFVLAPQHETSCDSEITMKEYFDHWKKQLKKAT